VRRRKNVTGTTNPKGIPHMRKHLVSCAALLANIGASAYTPSGTFQPWACDDTESNHQITMQSVCTVGSNCTLSWASEDFTFRLDYMYLWATGEDHEPLADDSTNGMPVTSCTENGGDNGTTPGYNCLRSKAVGQFGSTNGCQPGGCTYRLWETSPANEVYFNGSRWTAMSYTDFTYSAGGAFTWKVTQAPVHWWTAEVYYSCESGGTRWGFQKDFLIHVVNP
jgi:hypothetical protein